MTTWTAGARGTPKDRRLLLIVTPQGMPVADQEPDIVIGHWHSQNSGFVAVKPPCDDGLGPGPLLDVKWWAELPDLPHEVSLRPLTDND